MGSRLIDYLSLSPSVSRLYDSNILIDYLKRFAAAQTLIHDAPDAAISVLSWIEVLIGVKPEEEQSARLFLSEFRILPITNPVMEQAVLLRRTTRLKLPDAIILATAQISGRILVTRNTRDFPASPHIHHPYEL